MAVQKFEGELQILINRFSTPASDDGSSEERVVSRDQLILMFREVDAFREIETED